MNSNNIVIYKRRNNSARIKGEQQVAGVDGRRQCIVRLGAVVVWLTKRLKNPQIKYK